MNLKYPLFSVASAFGVLLVANSVLAQGTGFTYQGRLNDAGSPANGNYDLVFTLFDAQTNGTNVSASITNSTTGVSNGLFAVELDFGAGVFTGPARWLEIAVRTNGGGGFTTLAPRQQLTPTPYAITAESANSLAQALGPGQILVGNAHSNAVAVTLSGDIAVNSNGVTALKPTGNAGTYFETTFNANGVETSGSNPTTLSGFGITDGSTTAGMFTNSGNTLAGNAQGGAITNLDAAVANLLDNGRSFSSIISKLPSGGVIYIPTLTGTLYQTNVPLTINSNFTGPYIGQFNISPALTLRGTSSHNTILEFYGAHTNFIDQYSAPFGTGAVNLFNLALEDDIADGGLNSIGYVSAPGAGSSAYWNDVSFKDFLIGASTTVSSGEYDNIQASHNGVGFILAPYSDASILNLIYGFNNTNAAVESLSRGNRIYAVATHCNVGVEVGGGGFDDIQLSAESLTNCGVAIGYGTDWPFYNHPFNGNANTPYTGFCNGNNAFIYPITVHDGYFQGQSVNWTNPFAYNNAALVKVFSTHTIAGVTVRDVDTANDSMPALISYTRSGDTAPYEFDSVSVGSTNLVEFSTSNTIPSQDGAKVTVNLPQNDFTQNVLMRSYSTNGTETVMALSAGSITATNPSSVPLNGLTLKGGAFNPTNIINGPGNSGGSVSLDPNSDDTMQIVNITTGSSPAANSQLATIWFSTVQMATNRAAFIVNMNGIAGGALHSASANLFCTNFTVSNYQVWDGTGTLQASATTKIAVMPVK